MSVHGCWPLFVGICLCSQAVVSVCGQLFPFVGVPLHSWAVVSIHRHSFSFVGGQLHLWAFISVWWCAVGGFLDLCGCSCCIGVVAGGVVIVVTCSWWFIVICHCGTCDVAPASVIVPSVYDLFPTFFLFL